MRALLAATLIFATSAGAYAQRATPPFPGTTQRPGITPGTPVRPAPPTPPKPTDAKARAERLSLQSDLAWVGQYNGAINGELNDRFVNSIKEYQKAAGGRPTGVLNPQERGLLAGAARKAQELVGWKIVTEPTTGARLGIPGKLVPQVSTDANGSKWRSPTGTVQVILSRQREANPTTAMLAEREKKAPAGRRVDYTVVKPDFFVLSGLQGLKKFYVRGTFQGDEVRIMTVLYDQATENMVDPVVIAMSSAFDAFPAGVQAPAPRKTVEYGTGVVASEDGTIVTDRAITDGCLGVTVSGYGRADRLAEDKTHDLALLRIYGAHGLKPLDLSGGSAGGSAAPSVNVVGIADPQYQVGGSAVSSLKAATASSASIEGEPILVPAPEVGFSGSAAIDGSGKFAGIALLKPAVVAGPATSSPAQAVLVPANTVRGFLKANAIAANGSSLDAKSAVVRVICVRK